MAKVRKLIRANSAKICQKNVDHMVKRGWTPITEVKLDPSPSIDVSYVCVMEREEKSEHSNKRRIF